MANVVQADTLLSREGLKMAYCYQKHSQSQYEAGQFLIRAELLPADIALLVDVGCGTGEITADLAIAVSPKERVVGIDSNPHHIEVAKTTWRHISNLSFSVAEAEKLPSEDGQVDCYFSNSSSQ